MELIKIWLYYKTAGEGGGLGVEGLSKKEKALMDMDNRVGIAGGGGIRGPNGNGNNTIKITHQKNP